MPLPPASGRRAVAVTSLPWATGLKVPHAPLTRSGTRCSGTRDLAQVTHVCCTLQQWLLTRTAAACMAQAQATGLAGRGYPARLALAEAAADIACSTAWEAAHVRVELPSLLNDVAAGCHAPPLPAGVRASRGQGNQHQKHQSHAGLEAGLWCGSACLVSSTTHCQATWALPDAPYTMVCTGAAELGVARHTPEPRRTRAAR